MIDKKYDHQLVEEGRYQTWLENGYFNAGDQSKEPFCIVIPPPNVTGKLHLGHAWDNTIQDIIIRQKRMQGYDALYLPGMDHAGIATQAKIDEKLKSEGVSRYDLGREGFLKEAWNWKESYAKTIRSQWEALGLSVDYSKERFTLDEGLSQAVENVFIKLYEKGFIYRKERIIHWDVQAKTALSNIEVERKDIEGALYTLRYVTDDGLDEIQVATTRPETMFADTAVMLHPDDQKRAHLIGKKVLIPGTDVAIPVIADDYVDQEFGTGAVKVTPAHDPNDFEVGLRHQLPMPSCMNEDGTMNAIAFEYQGMERFSCRKKLVKDLQEKGLLTDIKPIIHNVGHSERTGVVVEPRLSLQWFVKMEELAQKALDKSTAEFIPNRFEKIFKHWMESIEDWCISRQLWWGHRIPAYYHEGDVYVGTHPPQGYVQDEDVLDTWFSSALWPFSTLGWPDDADDFKRYYPNDVMVTGYDIIFFWVSRMIFQALEFTDQTPFKHVLIHGLIRDAKGQKMSKSLGNGIDPMDIKKEFGMDTLRYFLTTNSAPGQDLRFEFEKVESSWNYINKIWNIARYVMMQVEGKSIEHPIQTLKGLPNQAIMAELNGLIEAVNHLYERYELSEAAHLIYQFTWDSFASWYVEFSKPLIQQGDPETIRETENVMVYVLTQILKLLHPFMPFVTEYLYQALPLKDAESIMIAAWPTITEHVVSEEVIQTYTDLKTLISHIRQLRNTYQVAPKKPIIIRIDTEHPEPFITHQSLIEGFINPEAFLINQTSKGAEELTEVFSRFTVHVPLGDLVDVEAEIKKQELQLEATLQEIKRAEAMLSNPQFIEKAPEAKVNEEKAKKEQYERQYEAIKAHIDTLKK